VAAPGFVDLPSSPNFAFSYNKNLVAAAAKALGTALRETAERDFATMTAWFGGARPPAVPLDVKINEGSGGANNDNTHNVNLRLGATGDFNLARFVLVAEVVEIFMAQCSSNWHPGDSIGEGLSQLAGFELYPDQRSILNGPQVWLDTSVSPTAASPSRPDFVRAAEATDGNFVSFGCSLLFLYYLRSQLGFSMRAVIRADEPSLEGVFSSLTLDRGGFATFSAVLERTFPAGTACGLAGSANPFPLPSDESLSARQWMAKAEMDPTLFGQAVRSNRLLGDARALLNTDRPASLIR
jgi:hypothetical protein